MADNSILCSKYIQQILEENEEVRQIVGTDSHQIFPLLQPKDINFPFVVHSRNSITTSYTKDIEITGHGWWNRIDYTVICVSDDYIQALDLANACRHALECYRWKDKDIYIHPIQIQSISEWVNEDMAYIEELHLTFMVE